MLLPRPYDRIERFNEEDSKAFHISSKKLFLVSAKEGVGGHSTLISLILQFLATDFHENLLPLEKLRIFGDGRLEFEYEFEGLSLAGLFLSGGLSDSQKQFLAFNILHIIDFFHSFEMALHCVRPSNILLSEFCNVRLKGVHDAFSVKNNFTGEQVVFPPEAMDAEELAYRWEKTGLRLQEMRYASPEELLNGLLGPASDMWSFGVILYEIITEKPLFTARSHLEMVCQVLEFTGVPSPEVLDKMGVGETGRAMIRGILELRPGLVFDRSQQLMSRIKNPTLRKMVSKILEFDPTKRITASVLFQKKYFTEYKVNEREVKVANEIWFKILMLVEEERERLRKESESVFRMSGIPQEAELSAKPVSLAEVGAKDSQATVPGSRMRGLSNSSKYLESVGRKTKPRSSNKIYPINSLDELIDKQAQFEIECSPGNVFDVIEKNHEQFRRLSELEVISIPTFLRYLTREFSVEVLKRKDFLRLLVAFMDREDSL